MRAAIKILHMVAALLFQKLLPGSNKISVPLGSRCPVHECYEGNCPGAVLLGESNRRVETTLPRLHSGHTRVQWHEACLKVYPPCPNCKVTQTASIHILAFIGCHKSQLLSSPSTQFFIA
ncbi:hypothetical protein TNCV_4213151 [Trichonephila clavipes]|nr:hypothetical protein TNCV_4213151 [Trichonephila clavipes]